MTPWFKIVCRAVAVLTSCAAFAAAPVPKTSVTLAPVLPAGPPPITPDCRYLFVVDTSAAMQRFAEGLYRSTHRLIATGLGGRMRDGEIFTLWTYADTVLTREFPLNAWTPELNVALANRSYEFLQRQKFRGTSNLRPVFAELRPVLAIATNLTVILISDGSDVIVGTPFDRPINITYGQRAQELRAAKLPFVTSLVTERGEFTQWSVRAGLEDIGLVMPVLPVLLAAPAPVAEVRPVAPTTNAPPVVAVPAPKPVITNAPAPPRPEPVVPPKPVVATNAVAPPPPPAPLVVNPPKPPPVTPPVVIPKPSVTEAAKLSPPAAKTNAPVAVPVPILPVPPTKVAEPLPVPPPTLDKQPVRPTLPSPPVVEKVDPVRQTVRMEIERAVRKANGNLNELPPLPPTTLSEPPPAPKIELLRPARDATNATAASAPLAARVLPPPPKITNAPVELPKPPPVPVAPAAKMNSATSVVATNPLPRVTVPPTKVAVSLPPAPVTNATVVATNQTKSIPIIVPPKREPPVRVEIAKPTNSVPIPVLRTSATNVVTNVATKPVTNSPVKKVELPAKPATSNAVAVVTKPVTNSPTNATSPPLAVVQPVTHASGANGWVYLAAAVLLFLTAGGLIAWLLRPKPNPSAISQSLEEPPK